MNPVEIEEAVSNLVLEPFDRAEFPFQFLAAFGNKETALQRLRAGNTNQSDIPGAVLQRGHIHIATCAPGEVDDTLKALRDSPKTVSQKARFILATDGELLQAEDLNGGETVACGYADIPDKFAFFLPLAGVTYTRELKETELDRRAAKRLQRLYLELLKDNPDWASRQYDMNHFMARLIFCFFAEDTDIFLGDGLFSKTIEQMSARDASDTHLVMSEIFRAMDTKPADREAAGIKRYASQFPYVNGQLFSSSTECPRFSKIARSYLLHIGSLDWQKINPDIFGSMIQAVTDDEERGALGMHYTSVPNILKVLNPLFLDELRTKLEEAHDNQRKLLNLRQRMAKIRVFDPACGSGNFLVIAYKEMRAIEAEINKRRGEPDRRSDIPLTNFRGIELRDFPAEIARLALIIAEYQCDVTYRGQKEALAEFLPLDSQNWITCGNALRLDWLSICPPTGTGVKVRSDDLFSTPLDQAEIDFQNEGGETYICGNPPYSGLSSQEDEQKDDLQQLFQGVTAYWKSFDYVMGWFYKAHNFIKGQNARAAFVSTNSICQGQLVHMFWPLVLNDGSNIFFAHSSFKWQNLASNNAGVTVVVVGISCELVRDAKIYEIGNNGDVIERSVPNVSPYIVAGPNLYIEACAKPVNGLPVMYWGNKPTDGGNLVLSPEEKRGVLQEWVQDEAFLRPYYGSDEFIKGAPRYCIWATDEEARDHTFSPFLSNRIEKVREFRASSKAKETRPAALYPHRFRQIQGFPGQRSVVVPIHTSENRNYLPVGVLPEGCIISNAAYALYAAPVWCISLIASTLHLVWIATVCGKLETRYRYSNTLGWNTFPVPTLTDQNKTDLTRCAEDILLAREAQFPATIADLYDPETMPEDLRAAHERNDEVLERIYIGRRFRNDTERLEKLFELYTKMTSKGKAA